MAMQFEVFDFIHRTHPAATGLRADPTVRDGLADYRSGIALRSFPSKRHEALLLPSRVPAAMVISSNPIAS
jgi:hypothetical protein